jgi:hypothetical protein
MTANQFQGFGDARANIVSALAIVLGKDKAEAWMKDFEALVKQKVKEGAIAALDNPQVQKKLRPYVIGAVAVGSIFTIGGILGFIAFARSRRRS